ncbi:MAG: hypothetical protein AAF675_16130 [Pseudomonadota bacterium]
MSRAVHSREASPSARPTAQSEPFAWSVQDHAAAAQFALLWSVPMRAMMVVMHEATRPYRR